MSKYVGKNIPRLDGVEKVTGTAGFTHDIFLPGMLYAKVLRSPHAHARIVSIDCSEAERLPGVHAVVTYKNTPRTLYNSSAWMAIAGSQFQVVLDQHILEETMRYVGDEVAAVAADSEEIAAAACRLIKVEYQVLPAVTDPVDAIKDQAPLIHDNGFGKNVACQPSQAGSGDFERAWAECDVTYEGVFKLPIQKQVPMETSAAVAYWEPDNKLTVWCNTQTPHPVRQILAKIFDLSEGRVRVLNPPYIGGGFGQRSGLCGKAEVLATALSQMVRRPVKLVYDRYEEMAATDSRHSGYVQLRMGAKADGTFHALELDPLLNTGAYLSWGGTMSLKIYAFGVNVYRFPNTKHYGKTVYANILPAGAFRGFGNPQSMFAIETGVDDLARQLGRDPIDLRLQNIIRVNDDWELAFPCLSTELRECVLRAAEEIGWKEKRGRQQQGTLRRGVGIAVGRHISASDPESGVYLRLEADGSFHMATGLSDMGNGVDTTLPQILAEAMDIPVDKISVNLGDTGSSPYDIGGHSTRSLYDRGKAVLDGAEQLRSLLRVYAAETWGLPEEQVSYEGGLLRGAGNTWTLAEAAAYGHRRAKHFEVIGRANITSAVPWHAHAVEVEVDTETGMVRVLKVAAAHDVGVAINPLIVEGQIEGGVMQAIGYALREEMTFSPEGKLYNDSIHKYMLPTAEDIPEIVSIIVEGSEPLGPYGAKGIGESSVVPTAAAIASAVEDAIGIRLTELPMTPMRVLKAIKEAQANA